MARVLIPLADGFEEIEAVSSIDILRRGNVEVVTAAVGGSASVRGAHGMVMRADVLLADVAEEDFLAVLLPGGGEGVENLRRCDLLFSILRRHNRDGRLLCAICAAPVLLVEAGVVAEGLHITCYPTCQMELDRNWSPAPVVVEGNVVTGQGPGTSFLFALVVLKLLVGETVARKVARGMVTDVLD